VALGSDPQWEGMLVGISFFVPVGQLRPLVLPTIVFSSPALPPVSQHEQGLSKSVFAVVSLLLALLICGILVKNVSPPPCVCSPF